MSKWSKYLAFFLTITVILAIIYYYNMDFIRIETEQSGESPQDRIDTSVEEEKDFDTDKNKEIKEYKSFNVLFIGVDASQNDASRADVIMLAHVIPNSKKINIVSIPRDTRVDIEGIGKTKINHAYMIGDKGEEKNGIELTVQTVSKLFDNVEIDYFIKTDFQGFKMIVDHVGGIEIELDEPVQITGTDITLPTGQQHLTGNMALSLARERYSLADGDFARQRHQVMIIKALIKKMQKPENLKYLPSLINEMKDGMVETNFSVNDILSFTWLFHDLSSENISYIQLEGKSGSGFDPLVQQKLYFWIPNTDAIDNILTLYLAE